MALEMAAQGLRPRIGTGRTRLTDGCLFKSPCMLTDLSGGALSAVAPSGSLREVSRSGAPERVWIVLAAPDPNGHQPEASTRSLASWRQEGFSLSGKMDI